MNVPVKAEPKNRRSLLLDQDRFELAQRSARALALSPIIPKHLREGGPEVAIANCTLVLDMADRMNENPLVIAQSIYFVSGKPGWSSTFMIAKANQSDKFVDPIDWRVEGKDATLVVTAFAKLRATGKIVEAETSMKMAMAEKWTKNEKYKSMPEQMLKYRSATFLVRLYAPEVMLGLPAIDEMEDLSASEMKDVTPPQEDAKLDSEPKLGSKNSDKSEAKPKEEPKKSTSKPKQKEADDAVVEDAEIVDNSDAPDQEMLKDIVARVVGDLGEMSNHEEIEATFEMFKPELDQVRQFYPEGMEEVDGAKEDAEARANGADE
ncbi:MAG: recombinase RecT [Pseudomonadota bacterium]